MSVKSLKKQHQQSDMRRSKGQNTKEALIAAAIRLFGERGFDGASTRAIAQVAGCNIGLISFHFSSKAGLYREARERLKSQLKSLILPTTEHLAAIDTATTDYAEIQRTLASEMRRILLGLLDHAGDHTYFLLLRRSLRAGDEEAKELYDEVFLPLFNTLENLLNASYPARKRENGLRTFLVIDTAIAILRDYPSLYEGTGHNTSPEEDTLLLADILCSVLWSDREYQGTPCL